MMRSRSAERVTLTLAASMALVLCLLLILPLASLFVSASLPDIVSAVAHPQFLPALTLSLRTTLQSLALVIVAGTPLAWWLATSPSRLVRPLSLLVSLPIVVPPAVLGVALLQTFGRQGLAGPALRALGLSIPFTHSAVLVAQVVVSAPFFVQAAAAAFRRIDRDMLLVARTLGASPLGSVLWVALPVALPGLLVGASLSWARSLGEFGATLLFAGNRSGVTQTMPLAIYSALESDVRLAVVFSLVLVAIAAGLLLLLRLIPRSAGGQAEASLDEFR